MVSVTVNRNERNVTLSGQDVVSLICRTCASQAAAELTFTNVTDSIPSTPALIIHVIPCLSISGGTDAMCNGPYNHLKVLDNKLLNKHEGIVGDLRRINQSRPPTGGTTGKVKKVMTSQVASVCDLETFWLQRLIYPFVKSCHVTQNKSKQSNTKAAGW